jgi:predicted transposase/invertase (TIGR01784 family)
LLKFTKIETALKTIQDKWLYFIKNAGDLDYIPNNIDQELEKAFNIANEANLSVEELELQQKKRDWIYIQKSSIELATKTGLKQGLEQGEWNAKTKMVLNAAQMGLPVSTISQLTGLDEKKVLSILQKN